MRKQWKQWKTFIFLGSKITVDNDYSHEIKRCLLFGRKAMTNLDSILKSRHMTLPAKIHILKAVVFPIVMYGCESLIVSKTKPQRIDAFKLWCWRRLLRPPWTVRKIKPVNPKGNQPWIFIGRIDTEAEALILWPPDATRWPTGKDSDARKNWEQAEKGALEDEMVGWHHPLNGHEFEQTLGDSERQGGLDCHFPCDCKELNVT